MKLAIIGASIGQYPLCLKARELGVERVIEVVKGRWSIRII